MRSQRKRRPRIAPSHHHTKTGGHDHYWCVEWHQSIGSTMARAAVLAGDGAPAGTVVVADFQSAGRGTRGRVWTAPPGTCLMFTLVVRPDIEPTMLSELPLLVAEAVSGVLNDEPGPRCHVEPPNDVMLNGRKVCGVLCNSRVQGDRVEWVLCGIGVNTLMTSEQLPTREATSLLLERGRAPAHGEMLERLLRRLLFLRDERPVR